HRGGLRPGPGGWRPDLPHHQGDPGGRAGGLPFSPGGRRLRHAGPAARPGRPVREGGAPMIPTHQLEATLRRLKLSGMLDTLEARLAQARAGELGHLEFLQALCEDEITRRATTALARRVRAARFDEVATLEGFDFSYNPKIPAAVIRDLAALGFVEASESVIL